ncbi:MAG: sulfatase-like hydrolase/transferase [Planctomycetota bacterium]|nr:sulfatase-like hydrolase/transferase [Planctomycetota bacterium]
MTSKLPHRRTRRFSHAPWLLFCAAAAASCGAPAAEPRAAPSSVLLVTIDTLRADRLGCYGHTRAHTPNIDGLATRGVRFERALSVAPLTFPAHVSLMSGTIPPHHGARDNGVFRAVEELDLLAEVLRETGLRTAAFTAAFVLDSQFGLDQGFEEYGDVPQRVMHPKGMLEHRSAAEVNAEAFAWLNTLDESEPFFLWLHYFEPHLPYPPPNERPAALRDHPYDAEVSNADRALGQVLARLEELGRGEETLVVLTSDHGESLGEHGEASHSFFVYQAVLHVPLIFSHASLPAGSTVSSNASLVDVMPTLLELLEIEGPPLPPPARSLAASVRGAASTASSPPPPVYFESLNSLLNYGWAPLQGVTLGDDKYIRAPRAELYDIARDPAELSNLLATDAERARALEEMLVALLAANPGREGAERELSDSDRVRLAGLGYTGAASPAVTENTLADPKDGIERVRKEELILELFNAGRHAEGVGVLRELLEGDPANPVFNSRFGFVQLMQGRFDEAIPYLERSIENGYRVAENVTNLALCFLYTQRLDRARTVFEEALAINAKYLPALFGLAQVHVGQGDPDAARDRLDELLGLWRGGEDPIIAQARQLLATLPR